MFIKWREENPHLPQQHRWYAYLAKSHRIQGKPRQQIITYLASIPACRMQRPLDADWKSFWYKAHCALLLAHVDYHTYQEVMALLGQRVARPANNEELARLVAEEFQVHPSWHKDYQAVCQVIERSAYYLE
jgi:hypothetical protein